MRGTPNSAACVRKPRLRRCASALRGALPDPVLRVELMNFNNYGSNAAPSLLPSRVGETKYTLMQSIPAWGKRGLRRESAAADARQAEARAQATTWAELSARIKTTFAEYYRAAGNERLTREVLDLLARLDQVAQARYAGGLVTQQDAIRAQLEQTAMRSDTQRIDAQALEQVLREAGIEQIAPLPSAPTGDRAAAPAQAGHLLRPLAKQVAELEQDAIAAALSATSGNKFAAARMLGISRATLYGRLG